MHLYVIWLSFSWCTIINPILLTYVSPYCYHGISLSMAFTPACVTYEDLCARSRYQGQGQVITSHSICGMLLLVPALDTCFWYASPQLYLPNVTQGLYSLSSKTYYRKMVWSLKAVRLGVMIISLLILTGGSAALLPRCLSNSRTIRLL